MITGLYEAHQNATIFGAVAFAIKRSLFVPNVHIYIPIRCYLGMQIGRRGLGHIVPTMSVGLWIVEDFHHIIKRQHAPLGGSLFYRFFGFLIGGALLATPSLVAGRHFYFFALTGAGGVTAGAAGVLAATALASMVALALIASTTV